ncbi:MAG: amidohydrolase family protein [Variovorax sp.]
MIDVHSHDLPDFYLAALDAAGRRPSLPNFPNWSEQGCLALMDRFGIEASILSVSTPGVHFGEDAAAAALARRRNEYCDGPFDRSGGRLGAFAALPLPSIDAALTEAAYALDVLKLDGVGLFANYEGVFLGDPAFDPLLAELDRRGAVAFVHPMGHASSRTLKLAAPLWMLEYPIDTTRAALNMIVHDVPKRFARIRFILAHAGGALPYLGGRIGASSLIDPRFASLTQKSVAEDLAWFFYETAQATSAATFGALHEAAPMSQVLFGSDFPYCGAPAIEAMVDQLQTRFDRSAADATAKHLFPRFT